MENTPFCILDPWVSGNQPKVFIHWELSGLAHEICNILHIDPRPLNLLFSSARNLIKLKNSIVI
jgi:hypothetical protein